MRAGSFVPCSSSLPGRFYPAQFSGAWLFPSTTAGFGWRLPVERAPLSANSEFNRYQSLVARSRKQT
eukprot:16380545-Heterocapsa_arctica.AAC.1